MLTPDHEEFFEKCRDHVIVLKCYGGARVCSVEKLYQHFKARLMAELNLQEPTIKADEE